MSMQRGFMDYYMAGVLTSVIGAAVSAALASLVTSAFNPGLLPAILVGVVPITVYHAFALWNLRRTTSDEEIMDEVNRAIEAEVGGLQAVPYTPTERPDAEFEDAPCAVYCFLCNKVHEIDLPPGWAVSAVRVALVGGEHCDAKARLCPSCSEAAHAARERLDRPPTADEVARLRTGVEGD